jgi:hypothetical protein
MSGGSEGKQFFFAKKNQKTLFIPARLISDSLFGIPKIEDFRFDALM